MLTFEVHLNFISENILYANSLPLLIQIPAFPIQKLFIFSNKRVDNCHNMYILSRCVGLELGQLHSSHA